MSEINKRSVDPITGYRILDVHTHPTFEGQNTEKCQVDELVRYGQSLGVQQMVVLGDVFLHGRLPTASQVKDINDKTAELITWYPDYFIGFCFLNPLLGEAFVHDETERCIRENGFQGIKLEICNNARDACMEPVMQQALRYGVPVLQHSADQTIIQERAFHTDPADTAWLGRQYPEVKIIMAHLTACGFRGVREIEDVENIWIDTSSYPPVAGMVEYAVRYLGANRVLYGSDLIIRDLPVQIGRILSARISKQQKHDILFNNAVQLLGLGEPFG